MGHLGNHPVHHHHQHGHERPGANEALLHAINYDTGNKSTKEAVTQGASKMRRDSINGEVSKLRDLLPLPSSTRQRLSQLQLMALICVYVRKTNFFDKLYKTIGVDVRRHHDTPCFGFSKAMNGFMMMITQTGKLLFISENAAEYLGHSMEDLLIHGDSIYDIIDKQDHGTIQTELLRGQDQINPEEISATKPENRIFLCRMNVSRNARRQMRFGDQKVILVEGHFFGILPNVSRNEPVFIAWCTPVAMPETRECVVQGATNIFTSIHSMDLKITQIDANGEHHLGYSKHDLHGVSFYHLLHPDCMREVQSKHRLTTQSENDRSCILLLRLQKQDGSWLWVHTVLQVKENLEESTTPVIVCTNQVLCEAEAAVMRSNSWLYHYYMVQSRLQYGLAYGAHPPPHLAAYYPHMLGPGQHQPFSPYDHGASSIHSAYLHATHLTGGSLAPSPYPAYGYNPSVGSYHLPESASHPNHIHVTETKEGAGPLDFSRAPDWDPKIDVRAKDVGEDRPGYLSHWDSYLRPQDLSSSKQSSPSWKSDSSGSPLSLQPLESAYGSSIGSEVGLMTRTSFHHSSQRLKQVPIEYNPRHLYPSEAHRVPEAHSEPVSMFNSEWRPESLVRHPLSSWSDIQMGGVGKLAREEEKLLEDSYRKQFKKELDRKMYSDRNNNPPSDNFPLKAPN